jgi:hypothetical protein
MPIQVMVFARLSGYGCRSFGAMADSWAQDPIICSWPQTFPPPNLQWGCHPPDEDPTPQSSPKLDDGKPAGSFTNSWAFQNQTVFDVETKTVKGEWRKPVKMFIKQKQQWMGFRLRLVQKLSKWMVVFFFCVSSVHMITNKNHLGPWEWI